ncbi:hypothetical protein [Polynucleobacter sp. MG-6-Vaara-E2]|jgi:drug/metabolite transporter (DMT)-like permease|uniref:hypothetical protein n=1 Tax=Polynucleobacter sp. MG-6-Vaara-E2 TaxID=2576932 RepID=UPI001BFE2298|nr:hypothetical protein [Polynucleobacter sp. MG-6-Vaara-E2]QWD97089.1 hypothetical protein ICV38_02695 [Polynucleobacter sp. MG-6-Vaara-E2]
MSEFMPLFASVISSFSRAGLNVVDRKQFRQDKVCPLIISYWNNLLPIILMLPIILFTPAIDDCFDDLLSLEVASLSILIQFVAYAFSYAFMVLRVTDVAVLSKSADLTVPLILVLLGFYSISYGVFLLLPIVFAIFIFSAGVDVVKKTYKPSIVLVLMLTTQGLFASFVGLDMSLGRGFWGLLSVAFSVLVWRFGFSCFLLLFKHKVSDIFIFPRHFISHAGFYLRGFLTVVTQVTFIFAITAKNLMVLWPILNSTGFLGAVFAYLFLGEKVRLRDFIFISFVFFITGVVVFSVSYEKI